MMNIQTLVRGKLMPGPPLRGGCILSWSWWKGIPITRHCDEHELSTGIGSSFISRSATPSSTPIKKGIIHRDIKPSNVAG